MAEKIRAHVAAKPDDFARLAAKYSVDVDTRTEGDGAIATRGPSQFWATASQGECLAAWFDHGPSVITLETVLNGRIVWRT